jgi:hypothetical protein
MGKNGIRIARGSIVDACIISAPNSTKKLGVGHHDPALALR